MPRLRRPATCPSCASPEVREIIWGLPDAELFEHAEADPHLTLGGCDIIDTEWKWDCAACGNRWGGAPV